MDAIIKLENISDTIILLVIDDKSFELLKKDYSEILADLTSFKGNPSCTCKARVIKFFAEKIEKEPGCLDKYITNIDDFNNKLRIVNEKRDQNNYSGKVFEIEKTNEAWNNFCKDKITGKSFRGFSVVERENSVVIYFI
jgi:hypothetical protein